MSLADRWAEFIYRVATTKNRLKIIITPVGLIFWLGLSTSLILASLWVDRLLPQQLFFSAPTNLALSVPLLIVGVTIIIWTNYNFFKAKGSPVPLNPPRKLVITGLYSRIRNPMILGWIIILFGLGILLNSITLIFIFTPLFILLNVLYLKAIEEKEMEKKFGRQYLEYKKSVPMFIPRFGKRK